MNDFIRCPHCKTPNPRPTGRPETLTCASCGKKFGLHLCPICRQMETANHYGCEVRQQGAGVCGKAKRRGDSEYYRGLQKKRWPKKEDEDRGETATETDLGEGL